MQRHKKAAITSVIAILVFCGMATITVSSIGRYQPDQKQPAAVVLNDSAKPTPPTPEELLKLVNEERAKVGVAPLVMAPELNKSAQLKADDMVRNNYFDHVDSNGKHGYMYAHEALPDKCTLPGENLRENNLENNTSMAVVHGDGWISSLAHYAGMVNPKSTITGFGIANNKIVAHFC